MDNTNNLQDLCPANQKPPLTPGLNPAQLQHYHQAGFIRAIEVLSEDEVSYFRHQLEQTMTLLGGNISRFDGAHEFFPWAWQLSTHPMILNCIASLIGPDIILKSTRFFYKHPNTDNFVGWHQDGYTEQEDGPYVPTIWLGLTDSFQGNGCLQLLPGSHLQVLVPHPKVPDDNNLTHGGITAQANIKHVINIEMPAGFMSLHHPLTIHGSQANISGQPRIGFSASYATSRLKSSICPVARLRGKAKLSAKLKLINEPEICTLEQGLINYQQTLGHSIRQTKK